MTPLGCPDCLLIRYEARSTGSPLFASSRPPGSTRVRIFFIATTFRMNAKISFPAALDSSTTIPVIIPFLPGPIIFIACFHSAQSHPVIYPFAFHDARTLDPVHPCISYEFFYPFVADHPWQMSPLLYGRFLFACRAIYLNRGSRSFSSTNERKNREASCSRDDVLQRTGSEGHRFSEVTIFASPRSRFKLYVNA